VPPDRLADLQANLHQVPFAVLGEFTTTPQLVVRHGGQPVLQLAVADLEATWKRPLDLDQTLVAGGVR
jgi:hypothetical protein